MKGTPLSRTLAPPKGTEVGAAGRQPFPSLWAEAHVRPPVLGSCQRKVST